jgi:hypothetical protein
MIGRNLVLNLVGHAAPLVAAIFLVPPLVARWESSDSAFRSRLGARRLPGAARLGIGRTLTRLVASREMESPELARAALSLTLVLGAMAESCSSSLPHLWPTVALAMPPGLQAEAVEALRLLALYLPWSR